MCVCVCLLKRIKESIGQKCMVTNQGQIRWTKIKTIEKLIDLDLDLEYSTDYCFNANFKKKNITSEYK